VIAELNTFYGNFVFPFMGS